MHCVPQDDSMPVELSPDYGSISFPLMPLQVQQYLDEMELDSADAGSFSLPVMPVEVLDDMRDSVGDDSVDGKCLEEQRWQNGDELLAAVRAVVSSASTRTGKELMQAIARQLEPFVMTMYGQGPELVADRDVSPSRIAMISRMRDNGLTHDRYTAVSDEYTAVSNAVSDRYTIAITNLLASGSNGAVMQVQQAQGPAVLKVVRQDTGQQSHSKSQALLLEMFVQSTLYCLFTDIGMTAAVPQVYAPVKLIDNSNAVYGLVMEELNHTLYWGIFQSELTDAQVNDCLRQVMAALAYLFNNAHFMHNDLRPDNVMLQRLPSGQFQVKLIDFGNACLNIGKARVLPDLATNANLEPFSTLCGRQSPLCDPAQLLGTILGYYNWDSENIGRPELYTFLAQLFKDSVVAIPQSHHYYQGLAQLYPRPAWLGSCGGDLLVYIETVPFQVDFGQYRDVRFILDYCKIVKDGRFDPARLERAFT